MNTKSATKSVTMYQASIKFEGKWITTPETATLDETLGFIKRAREKTRQKFLTCNIIENVRIVPAE